MDRRDVSHRFQLDHQAITNEEIKATLADGFAFVFHRRAKLLLELNPAQPKLNAQSFFVNALKKSRSKVTVHLNCRPDYGARKRVRFAIRLA